MKEQRIRKEEKSFIELLDDLSRAQRQIDEYLKRHQCAFTNAIKNIEKNNGFDKESKLFEL